MQIPDKEKILKAARDKKSLTFMGRSIRVTPDLSTETWQARKGCQDIFRVLNENMQPRISSKALIQNGRRDKELPRQAGTERKHLVKHEKTEINTEVTPSTFWTLVNQITYK